MKGYEILSIGFILILLGFSLVFIGIITHATKDAGEIRGGGVVMIGSIPIVFGTDTESVKIVVVLVIILILVAMLALRWWS
ncbi:MAG: DUF131 domain-containing protein [Candidatus Hydrothermarchaeales archaeon]